MIDGNTHAINRHLAEREEHDAWQEGRDAIEALADAEERIEELEAKLVKAVWALELSDRNLTNLQPKIANGLVHEDWVPVFDSYIDPVIDAARKTLADLKGQNDE